MNPKTYRKKQIQEPTYVVTWVSTDNKTNSFKSTKIMLQSHKLLMQNNPYIKEFSISAISKE